MATSKLLVLFYTGISDEDACRVEMDLLTSILHSIDNPECFCLANELVNRNKITNDKRKMLKEARHIRLREFRFFINKN